MPKTRIEGLSQSEGETQLLKNVFSCPQVAVICRHTQSRRRTQTFSSDHFLDDADEDGDDNEGVLSCLAKTDQLQFFGLYPILNSSLPAP